MKISNGVFLDFDSVHPSDLDLKHFETSLAHWQYHAATASEAVPRRIEGADVVVSNKVVLSGDILRQTPGIKLICVAATGTNNVDLDAARELGIAVTNVRAYGTAAVVQHVFTLVLALTTRLAQHQQAAIDGTWARSPYFCVLDYPFRELAGKVMGIVGHGVLGRGVAAVANAFGMHVVVAQRPGGEQQPDRMPLADLLGGADVVSLHVPLAENTRNLIGAAELALMKGDALLINTARGGIVDEIALLACLRSGQLGGAGFDVLAAEPPVDGNPLLKADLPNLIVTPHVAWAARESRQRLMDSVADSIRAFTAGTPLNLVQ